MVGSPPPGQRVSAFSERVVPLLEGLFLVQARVEPFSKTVALVFKRDRDWKPPSAAADDAWLGDEEEEAGGGVEGGRQQGGEELLLDDRGNFVLTEGVEAGMSEEAWEEHAFIAEGEGSDGEARGQKETGRGDDGGAEMWLDAAAAGMPRVIALNSDRKVITAAPAEEKNGGLWKGIGRRFYPGGVEKTVPTLDMSKEAWVEALMGAREGEGASPVLKTALLNAFAGMSPALVYQIIGGAGIPSHELCDDLTTHDFDRLYKIWKGWLWSLQDSNFAPVWSAASSRYSVVAWPRPEGYEKEEEGWEEEAEEVVEEGQFESVSVMVASYYQAAELKVRNHAFGQSLEMRRRSSGGEHSCVRTLQSPAPAWFFHLDTRRGS